MQISILITQTNKDIFAVFPITVSLKTGCRSGIPENLVQRLLLTVCWPGLTSKLAKFDIPSVVCPTVALSDAENVIKRWRSNPDVVVVLYVLIGVHLKRCPHLRSGSGKQNCISASCTMLCILNLTSARVRAGSFLIVVAID